eukprot:3132513-Rhodomonas_salina.1
MPPTTECWFCVGCCATFETDKGAKVYTRKACKGANIEKVPFGAGRYFNGVQESNQQVPFQELVQWLAAIMQIRLAKTSSLMMLEQYQSKWIWIHKQ